MSASFWIFSVVCIICFIPVCVDHGRAWGAFQKSQGKAKIVRGLLVIVLWATPILSLVGTILSGFESLQSEAEAPENRPIKAATAFARFSVRGFDLSTIKIPKGPFPPQKLFANIPCAFIIGAESPK
jgi:hypothetical protein